MPENATGRAQDPAQKLIHDRDDGDRRHRITLEGTGLGQFSDWLRLRAGRDDLVGDLARDVIEDEEWPEDASLPALHFYLYLEPASVHEALDLAWFEWMIQGWSS
jgi:hypothetical protein